MKNHVARIILAFCLGMLVVPVYAQQRIIEGMVANERGCGIGETQVTIEREDGTVLGTVWTYGTGRFTIGNVPAGKIFLVARHRYYRGKILQELEVGIRESNQRTEIVFDNARLHTFAPAKLPCDTILREHHDGYWSATGRLYLAPILTDGKLDKSMPGKTTFLAEDLERMPTRNLLDIASLAPDVYQRQSGSGLNIGGGRTENTLVIIDGIPIY